MAAQLPRAALDERLRTLPDSLEPLPGFSFRSLLAEPAPQPSPEDARQLQACRYADYKRLALRLDALIGQVKYHFDMHGIEALVASRLSDDGHEVLAYTSDVARAITEVQEILTPTVSPIFRQAVRS